MAVLVWDKRKQPLMPCSEKRARLPLERNRVVVVRIHPFTIRLKDRVGGDTHMGRVAVRAAGSFNIQTNAGLLQGISHRLCTLTQRADGYGYGIQSKMAATETEEARTKAA